MQIFTLVCKICIKTVLRYNWFYSDPLFNSPENEQINAN